MFAQQAPQHQQIRFLKQLYEEKMDIHRKSKQQVQATCTRLQARRDEQRIRASDRQNERIRLAKDFIDDMQSSNERAADNWASVMSKEAQKLDTLRRKREQEIKKLLDT